jgi:hypothetical protein
MKTITALQSLAGVAAVVLFSVTTATAEVRLTMQNGRVSISAKDATVRQILTEWARVGQTKIVNVERIPGGPITLELNNVAEAQALEILLRALSGYIAAPRPAETAAANLSRFDRIIVMPTLASARTPASGAPPPVFQQTPQFNQPPHVADDDNDDDQPAPNVPMPPPNRGPVFNTFPQQPQVVNPQTGQPVNGVPQQIPQQQPPASYPGAPTAPYGGVSVPGMIAPPPPMPPGQQMQPGQQQPNQPGMPVRRPGRPDDAR